MLAYSHGLGHESVHLLRKWLLKDESCCFKDGSGSSYGLWMIRMKLVVKDETGFFMDESCKHPKVAARAMEQGRGEGGERSCGIGAIGARGSSVAACATE